MSSGPAGRTAAVGVLSDPDFPAELAADLVGALPELLAQRVDGSVTWVVERRNDPLISVTHELSQVLDLARVRREQYGWNLAIYLTDIPVRSGWHPVLADISLVHGVAGISVPALGGWMLRRRVREVVIRVIGVLTGLRSAADLHLGLDARPWNRRLSRLVHPVRGVQPDEEEVDVRFIASLVRGRFRLLAGMVRTNQPWRLILGLASALTAVVATSAFGLLTDAMWQISDAVNVWRLVVATIGSITLMVGWIIYHHRLWERAADHRDREETILYNTVTVITLGLGVLVMTVAVFAVDLLICWFFLPGPILEQALHHPVGLLTYLNLVWLVTSAAVVGGALGSSLDSEDAVRRAAYGYRERLRRDERREPPDPDPSTGT
jgi:hypothetical protein